MMPGKLNDSSSAGKMSTAYLLKKMNYFNYYTEIEDEFVKRRGSHLWVSPLDWSLIETWKQRGVPLHIVLRGINSSFDSYDQRLSRGRKVNSLFYCQQEIEAMFLEYCESRVGSSKPTAGPALQTDGHSTLSPEAIIDYLSENRLTLAQLRGQFSEERVLPETFDRATMRVDQIIEDLQANTNISLEGLEKDLTIIEELILDGLKESAGEERLEQLRKEGNRQLRAYKQTMEKEIYQQTLENFIARRLREQYQTPRLSLFYL
jgi:hypothetical protein